jgi:hypothetical protein
LNLAQKHLEGLVNVSLIQEFIEQEEFAMQEVEAA